LGEAAIKAGYSGGSDRFWWILILKMLALGVLIAASYVLASFGISKLVAPSEKRASEASEKIQKAQELANLAEKRAQEAERERQNAERTSAQLKIKKTNLQTEIDELQSTIEILNDDIAKLKAAHDAFADL
jgi:septal ring factor EnvC (AmiA/AmiB activator)